MPSRKVIKPDGSNPWGLRITEYHRRMAGVTPEEVEYWAGPGLEEAQAKFSEISQNTVLEHQGKTYRGGKNPFLFSTSLKTEAGKESRIPELAGYHQVVHYQTPSRSGGIEGCNTCGFETAGCSKACFAHGGQMGLPGGKVAQLARTQFGFEHAGMFLGVGLAELRRHQRAAAQRGEKLLFRMGGTNEGLLHLMPANEAFEDLDAHNIEYTKAQSRDVVPKNKLITNPNPDKLTLVTSVTEHTTIPRMLQASEEQGQALAVPTKRLPHSVYPQIAQMIDRQGRRASFLSLLDPSSINEHGFGESLGDISDYRHTDRAISGITGGVLFLGGKRSRYIDEEGKERHAVIGEPFVREVNPSRQLIAFQRSDAARKAEAEAVASGTAESLTSRPTPVTLRPSRGKAFRGE